MPGQFERHEDIPDPLKDHEFMLIPAERLDLRIPQQDNHTPETTSPVEVAYALFVTHSIGLESVESRLLSQERANKTPVLKFFNNTWGCHTNRAIVRAALDPERLAPIHMRAVYDAELRRPGKNYPDLHEIYFFDHFVEYHGVVDRSNAPAD